MNGESWDVLWVKLRKVKKLAVTRNSTQDTWLVQPVLCHWARQPDNPHLPQLSICTAQMSWLLQLNSKQSLSTCHQNSVKGQPEILSIRRELMLCGCWVCDWSILVPQVHNCETLWLSRCCTSVEKHWLHNPGVLELISGNSQPFHFNYIIFIPMWGRSS